MWAFLVYSFSFGLSNFNRSLISSLTSQSFSCFRERFNSFSASSKLSSPNFLSNLVWYPPFALIFLGSIETKLLGYFLDMSKSMTANLMFFLPE